MDAPITERTPHIMDEQWWTRWLGYATLGAATGIVKYLSSVVYDKQKFEFWKLLAEPLMSIFAACLVGDFFTAYLPSPAVFICTGFFSWGGIKLVNKVYKLWEQKLLKRVDSLLSDDDEKDEAKK